MLLSAGVGSMKTFVQISLLLILISAFNNVPDTSEVDANDPVFAQLVSLYQLFCEACMAGDAETVHEFVKDYQPVFDDFDEKPVKRRRIDPPLQYGALFGGLKLAALYGQAGIFSTRLCDLDLQAEGNIILVNAVKSGNTDLVHALLQSGRVSGDPKDSSAFHEAIKARSARMVEGFLETEDFSVPDEVIEMLENEIINEPGAQEKGGLYYILQSFIYPSEKLHKALGNGATVYAENLIQDPSAFTADDVYELIAEAIEVDCKECVKALIRWPYATLDLQNAFINACSNFSVECAEIILGSGHLKLECRTFAKAIIATSKARHIDDDPEFDRKQRQILDFLITIPEDYAINMSPCTKKERNSQIVK